jgi:hypothetical protein
MYTTTTIIHYNRHLVLRQEFGKYKWRGKEFDTEEQAFKAIDDKILHFKNKNMEQNKFQWTDELVLEYLREMVIGKLGFENNHIEIFKASKTKPKEYEILSFSHNLFGVEVPKSIKRNDDGTFGAYFVEESVFLNSPTHKIDSVRRTSDNEVFSIGDEVEFGSGLLGDGKMQYNVKKIEKFYIDENGNLMVYFNGIEFLFLSQIKKAKQPILTTQDGKDIYEGDTYYSVAPNFTYVRSTADSTGVNGKWQLSTKEAAEEYILFNKPMLSIKDVENLFRVQDRQSIVMNRGCDVIKKEDLIELAKSKTKQ